MQLRVFWDDGHDSGEFEYFSKLDRINAKGIKDEIKNYMFKTYGSRAKYMNVTHWYRV